MKRNRLPRQRIMATPPSRRDILTYLLVGGGVVVGLEATAATVVGMLIHLKPSPSSPPVPLIAGHPGAVGTVSQPPNTGVAFRNPKDRSHNILVRLPDAKFVAYQQGCTHSGVLVDYDPATHMLVCPAHGAIFDPAQAGKVIAGPTTQPLAQLALRVEADGTITLV